ncbi:histidine phosphatase superfamily [Emericellopsis atlantica]|uniref:Histidine phosphatase superfamily n=1 Tax=Emericellopsis atlantica TaxID=2614577 RepID=A0A9P7ZT66_9HYPO|nr:histidine phosphatase superfamily [Emericellopsis atlantica]KAG9257651.1 histidine phosphatase superfamily [Emericellopsis atlantica]
MHPVLLQAESKTTTILAILTLTLALAPMAPIPTATRVQAVKQEWHAPAESNVNNLTTAVHGQGTYGFIFNRSDTPDDKYGTYNYCNMPHVRAKEYVKVDKNAFELQYVELIHRHHKRTPYASNAFPVEPYQWNCDDQGLYFYGRPFDGHDAAKGYRAGFISDVNPYVPSGWIGSCQFPQITPGGLDDSWQHGADLYGVYGQELGFLPAKGDKSFDDKVKYRVTNNVITSQVAGMLINGMWGTTEDVPLHVQATNIDSLEPQYSCPTGANVFNNIKSNNNPEWRSHLEEAEELYRALDDISGVDAGGNFHASFDPYFDNLSSRQCHGKPLPCKLVDGVEIDDCITQEMADAVYRLGHWEYSQMYRDHPDSFSAASANFGVWVAELAVHLREVMDGKRETIYFHNIAHDGSVSRLLSLLQIDEMVWPGMGAEVVFELYKKKKAGGGAQPPKPTSTVVAPDCSHNNCLRQMIRHSEAARSLCPSLTRSNTAESLPTWPVECDDVEEIYSACSCLDLQATATATDSPIPAPTATTTPSDSGFYVRVLFNGQVFKSSNPTLGEIDMLAAETLLAYFDDIAGKRASKVRDRCGN